MTTVLRNLIRRLRYGASEEHTVMILGLDNAGKTTLLYRLALGEVVTTIPSIGFNVESVDLGITTRSGKSLRLAAWETDGGGCGGTRYLRHLLPLYLVNSDAIIWVVDMTDKWRLEESVEMLTEVLEVLHRDNVKGDKIKSSFPILILANKCDNPNALKIDEIRTAFSKATAGRLSTIFKTSFTTKPPVGLTDAFEWLSFAFDVSKQASAALPPITSSETRTMPNPRSPTDLAQKLESWITRSENQADLSDDELLARFRSFNLPEWDHYTHIRLAYVILTKYGRRNGKDMLFKGLEEYIAASPDTNGKTFHLSMTYFWIQIVHFGIRNMPEASNEASVEGKVTTEESATTGQDLKPFSEFLLVNPHVVDGNLWSEYYSKGVLMSPQAKAEMVLPDKKPLPNLVIRDAIRAVGNVNYSAKDK
ncbi:ADP-ribosylation factor family-domain-containing protein [Panaeolus papilionaceus]|nr:ADP-ribosylation factor family-domain-containing protein [Panaeolus papilionaceus]